MSIFGTTEPVWWSDAKELLSDVVDPTLDAKCMIACDSRDS